jgi:PEP-CTERM motif
VNPAVTTFSFTDVDSVVGFGDFAGIGLHTATTTINTLTLTLQEILAPTGSGATRGRYSTGALSPWIDFGTRTIGGVTSNLSFNLNNTQVLRTRTSATGVRVVDIEGLTGAFNFDGTTVATGFLSGSRAGSANSYEITLDAVKTVPEPTTMLGLGLVAAGMTVASRRKLVKA